MHVDLKSVVYAPEGNAESYFSMNLLHSITINRLVIFRGGNLKHLQMFFFSLSFVKDVCESFISMPNVVLKYFHLLCIP